MRSEVDVSAKKGPGGKGLNERGIGMAALNFICIPHFSPSLCSSTKNEA